MSIDRALLEKMASARSTGGGNYIRGGNYSFTVKKFFGKKMESGLTYVVELQVDSAQANGEIDKGTNQPYTPNAVGTEASCVWAIEKQKSAAGNVKAFLLTALGVDEGKISAEDYIKLLLTYGDENTNKLRGLRVDCSTYQKQAKESKKWLTLPKWVTVPQTPEQIAARRSELDGGAPVAAAPVAAPAPAAEFKLPF